MPSGSWQWIPTGFVFSSRGRLRPGPFAIAILLVYFAGFASQGLLAGPIIGRSGIWPFMVVQVALTWFWFVLHAKRLHDANRGIGGAVAVALLYSLALLLLLLIIAFFMEIGTQQTNPPSDDVSPASFFALFILIGLFFHSFDLGFVNIIITFLVLIALAPAIIAIVFSIIVGTRASAPSPPVVAPVHPAEIAPTSAVPKA